jgi:hypothetical protein
MKAKLAAVIAAALSLVAPHAAQAQLDNVEHICGPMQFYAGSSGTREYVTSTTVEHDPGGWRIEHHMNNGTFHSRTSQYAVEDDSSASILRWNGPRRSNPAFHMYGSLFTLNGRVTYDEEVH